jgi:hypothetical protein
MSLFLTFAVDVVRKDENFVENAVLSDVRHDASTEHTQPDIPIETGSVLSIRQEIIPSPMFVRRRRRGNHRRNNDDIFWSQFLFLTCVLTCLVVGLVLGYQL